MPRRVIRNVDDLMLECRMLPEIRDIVIKPENPIEDYFLRMADKHGIVDDYNARFDSEDNYDDL